MALVDRRAVREGCYRAAGCLIVVRGILYQSMFVILVEQRLGPPVLALTALRRRRRRRHGGQLTHRPVPSPTPLSLTSVSQRQLGNSAQPSSTVSQTPLLQAGPNFRAVQLPHDPRRGVVRTRERTPSHLLLTVLSDRHARCIETDDAL